MDSWLVWSNDHRLWWCADQRGYTRFIKSAGRYTLAEADRICATGPQTFTDDQPNPIPCLCIQPSPEMLDALREAPDDLRLALVEVEQVNAARTAGAQAHLDWREALLAALRLNQPFPLTEVLRILADGVDHLDEAHDCDGDGWETRRRCRDAARGIITDLLKLDLSDG